MLCPTCRQLNPDEARFCFHCGAQIVTPAGYRRNESERTALERALGPQYEIVRMLGRGGMGVVYLAREVALERAVAIKVLLPGMAADADSQERFRREARTAAKLTHPNIVPLHTSGVVEGMPYFVMGYVRGESLGERMRRQGRLPADDVRRILGGLADALDHAHRQGVIHRDIKPDNVLLDDESGRPMLTDFGLAKARASGATLTEAGTVVGTAHYMSPEQASGAGDLDGRSDLYSLGVMGYAMLSGQLPFEGTTFRDVIVQHITRVPPPLTDLAPDAPADLAEAVTRCLAKDPAGRWPDGRTLHGAIAEGADPEPEFMPRLLRVLRGAVFWNLVFAPFFILGYWAVMFAITGEFFRFIRDGILLLILMPVGTYLQWRFALHKGYPRVQLRRLMTTSPRWWPFWWPARWSAPGDVWERLPPLIRRLRRLRFASGCLVYTLTLTILGWIGAGRPGPTEALGAAVMVSMLGQAAAAVVLLVGATFMAERWGKRYSLTAEEAAAMLGRPTTDRAFWRRAPFAQLLSGAPAGATRPVEPGAPAEVVGAIAVAVDQLGGPLRDVGAEALASAQHLVRLIDALETEIAQLSRDASLAELSQVEQRLAALGEEVADNDPRRQMRALLEGQRALLRGLAERQMAATQRRTHLTELLRTLWSHVVSLPAEAGPEGLSANATTGKLRELCQEIARHDEVVAFRSFLPRTEDHE